MQSPSRTYPIIIVLSVLLLFSFVYSDLRQVSFDLETNEQKVEWLNPLVVILQGEQIVEEVDGNAISTRNFDVIYRSSLFFNVLFVLFFLWGVVKFFVRPTANNDLLRSGIILLFWLSLARFVQLILVLFFMIAFELNERPLFENFDFLSTGMNVLVGLLCVFALKSMGGRTEEGGDFKYLGIPNWNRPFYMMFDRFVIVILIGNFFLFRYYYFSINGRYLRPEESEHIDLYLSLGVVLGMLVLIKVYSITEYLFVENFSIFADKPWHDSFTKSELVYSGSQNWIQRQSKIVKHFAIFFLIISIWNLWLVAKVIVAELTEYRGVDEVFAASELPLLLITIGAFFIMFLLSGWLASINNHFENVHDRVGVNRNGMYWEALFMWVPLIHFFMPSRINGNIRANVEINFGESEEETRVYRRSRLWGAFFHVFMIFFWLGVWVLLDAFRREEARIVASALMSFGSIFLSVGTWVYARAFEKADFHSSKLIPRDGEQL